MEMSLFKFMFAISLIIFAITLFYIKDNDLKIILSLISFIMFSALAFQSLNIEIAAYDGSWQFYQLQDYYLPLGIMFIFAVISGINLFVQLFDLILKPFQTNKQKYSRRNKFD